MTENTYILGGGPAPRESGRLDFQHVLFGKLTGTLLPHHISSHLATIASPRIADIGTGTASWLIDLSSQLPPSSSLTGFDINSETFPPAEKLPRNLTLQAHDALRSFPEEHLGTYDVVHARLLTYGFKKGEWEVVARNMASLLKPGGWVLWEETGYPCWSFIPPTPNIAALLQIDVAYAKDVGRDITHPAKLPSHVENAGLVDCGDKVHENFDVINTEEGHRIPVFGLGQALKGIVAKGGMPGLNTLEEAERLQQGMADDLRSGKSIFGMQLKQVWGGSRSKSLSCDVGIFE